jgi:hypothetical protein
MAPLGHTAIARESRPKKTFGLLSVVLSSVSSVLARLFVTNSEYEVALLPLRWSL